MTKGATRGKESKWAEGVFHVALELDEEGWKPALGRALGKRPWLRRVSPRDRAGMVAVIQAAKRRFGLGE